MSEITTKLELLVKKNKKSGLSKQDVINAGSFLKESYGRNMGDLSEVFNFLFLLHYDVSSEFIRANYLSFSVEEKTNFIHNFIQAKQFNDNLNSCGVFRAIAMFTEIAKKDLTDINLSILLERSVQLAEKKGSFSKKNTDFLQKHCLNIIGRKIFQIDYGNWKPTPLKKLSAWIVQVLGRGKNNELVDPFFDWVGVYNITFTDKETSVLSNKLNQAYTRTNEITSSKDTKIESPNKQGGDDQSTVGSASSPLALQMVDTLKQEIVRLVEKNRAFDKEISEYRNKAKKLEERIQILEGQINDMQSKNRAFAKDLHEKQAFIKNREEKIMDLEARLKNILNAEQYATNQELIAFKNDLAKQIRLDFEDFTNLRNEAKDIKYYDIMLGILENTFATLKGKGIKL